MQTLFNSYWPKIKSCLIKRGLIPFIIYFASTFVFNYHIIISTKGKMSSLMTLKIFWGCGPVMLISWGYFTYHEFLQMKACYKTTEGQTCKRIWKTLRLYYSRAWNFLDSFLILGVPLLFLQEMARLYSYHVSFNTAELLFFELFIV